MKLEGLVPATIGFPTDYGHVLLGRKTRIIGVGLYNGPGGGIDEGESINVATVREIFEETRLTVRPEDLEPRAVVHFHNFKKDGVTPFECKVYVSMAPVWMGDVASNGELTDLEWFSLAHPPLNEMMVGDRTWVPQIFAGKRLLAEVWYAPGMQTLAQPTRIRLCSAKVLAAHWVLP